MLCGKRVLAVIPARGGSKRLPNKNLLPFCGEPLISRSINAAKNSKYIDQIVVSSDSKEILEVASGLGVRAQERAPELAEDTSTSVDVALNVLDQYSEFDMLVWLQPTSPLRSADDIDAALELFISKQAESVVSVCEATHSPLWMSTMSENGQLLSFACLESAKKRSQDLDTFYQLNGAIYISEMVSFLTDKSFLTVDSYAYKMSREASIDIDTKIDFQLAELIAVEYDL